MNGAQLWERLTEGRRGKWEQRIDRWITITSDNQAAANQIASDPRIAVIDNGRIGLNPDFARAIGLTEAPPNKNSCRVVWSRTRYHGDSVTRRECDVSPDGYGNRFSLSDVPENETPKSEPGSVYPSVLLEGSHAWKAPMAGRACPVCRARFLKAGHYCLFCDRYGRDMATLEQDAVIAVDAAQWMMAGHKMGCAANRVSLTRRRLDELMNRVYGPDWERNVHVIANR